MVVRISLLSVSIRVCVLKVISQAGPFKCTREPLLHTVLGYQYQSYSETQLKSVLLPACMNALTLTRLSEESRKSDTIITPKSQWQILHGSVSTLRLDGQGNDFKTVVLSPISKWITPVMSTMIKAVSNYSLCFYNARSKCRSGLLICIYYYLLFIFCIY